MAIQWSDVPADDQVQPPPPGVAAPDAAPPAATAPLWQRVPEDTQGPPTTPGWGHTLLHGAGVFGTGLAQGVVSPVDLLERGYNLAARTAGAPESQLPLVSDWINRYGAAPEGTGERLLYGAGAGIGSLAMPGGVARMAATRLAESTPALVQALAEPVSSLSGAVRGAATGATSGAASTAVSDIAEKAAPDQPLVRELAGLTAGLVAPTAASVALGAPARAVGALARPFTSGGRDTLAGDLLRNVPESTADADIATIGAPGARSPETISTSAATRMEQIRKDAHDAAQANFDAVDPSGQATVDAAGLRQRYDDYVSGLPKVDQKYLPKGNEFQKDLLSFGDQEAFPEVQQFSSNLRSDASAAYNTDPNKGRVLRGLHDNLFPDGSPEAIGDASVQSNLATAKQNWRQYKETFEERKLPDGGTNPVAAITGGEGVAPSAALRTTLRAGDGQLERTNAYVRAAAGDDEALNAARDWVAAQLQTASQKPGGVKRFLDANGPLFDSDLFTAEHQAAVERLSQPQPTASGMFAADPLSGMRVQGAPLVGNVASMPLVSHLATYLPGGESTFGQMMALSAGSGAMHYGLGSRLADVAYRSPRQKMIDLLANAETDPALRQRLTALPAPGNVLQRPRTFAPGLVAGGAVPFATQATPGPRIDTLQMLR